MTPVGTSDTFGALPRSSGNIRQTSSGLPGSQLQPASSTILPRAVVKLSLGKVRVRALPLPMSATQSVIPMDAVVVDAIFFPSRDQSRARILPHTSPGVKGCVRPVAGSRISNDIRPLEIVVYAS